MRAAQPDEFDPRDFLPATEKNTADLLATAQAAIEQIQNPHLVALVRYFFDDPEFIRNLSEAPAAKRVHHAYLGGMLEHLAEVLAVCETVLTLYPAIDADLLRTGALLHDLGKLRELAWSPDIEYTDEGRLLGHVVLGAEMLAHALRQFPDFPPELALRVRHMLVAHHGRLEYGSPRQPRTLEAIALHKIEDLSAQINRFQSLLDARREVEGAWTRFDRLLGRSLYGGPGDDEPAAPDEATDE